KGVRFQQAVLEKMGTDGFAEVFRHPPDSTQQIMHPEKYFARVQPLEPPLPKLLDAKAYKEVADGTVGEFDHAILLKQYGGEDTEQLATKWRGGAYKLLEAKKGERIGLLYASEWEDAETAKRFFGLYRRVLAGKWKRFEVAEETESLLRGVGDDGEFVTR